MFGYVRTRAIVSYVWIVYVQTASVDRSFNLFWIELFFLFLFFLLVVPIWWRRRRCVCVCELQMIFFASYQFVEKKSSGDFWFKLLRHFSSSFSLVHSSSGQRACCLRWCIRLSVHCVLLLVGHPLRSRCWCQPAVKEIFWIDVFLDIFT